VPGAEEVHEPVSRDRPGAEAARFLERAGLRPFDAVEKLAGGGEP